MRPLGGVVVELHMDDFHGTGPPPECTRIIGLIRQHLRIKASPLLAPPVHYQHLRRHHVYDTAGFFIATDQRHLHNVIGELGLTGCRPAVLPHLPEDTAFAEGDDIEVDLQLAYSFRACVGSLLYVMDDRPDILWALGLLTPRLAKPNGLDLRRLRHLARYLAGTMDRGVWMPAPAAGARPGIVRLEICSDANWAAASTSRRSVSAWTVAADGCPLHSALRRQALIATSSAESEFYALSHAAMEAVMYDRILTFFGYSVHTVVATDSSAAKALALKQGVSRIRHLDTRALWIQDRVKSHNLVVCKRDGAKNPADLATKAHPRSRFTELLKMNCIVDRCVVDIPETEAAEVPGALSAAACIRLYSSSTPDLSL